MGVTISDVAERAQVSASTVSRVFNHGHLVQDATREHVISVARQMGYAPNATARNLRRGHTNALGVILPAPHGEFFSELIRGLDEAAQSSQHHLLISSSHYSPQEGKAAFDALAGRVDGLAIMAPKTEVVTWMERLGDSFPVVFLNTEADERCDVFDIENRQGAMRVVRHLVERGHRRIAAITGPPGSHDVEERMAGYRAALREHGLEPGVIEEGAFTQESGYEAGQRIAALPELPDAIFACNDYMAIGAMAAFQGAGLHIPTDLAVAGFDDIASARYANPPLTTVRVPARELGQKAAERLLQRLQAGGESLKPQTYMVKCELEVRGSTGA